jgi:hypothetical protein
VAGTCIPLTKEFRIDMALFEIPVSGCTCLRTTLEVSNILDPMSEVGDVQDWLEKWDRRDHFV